MAIATAGFTAALCVSALQRHGVKPGDGEVLVTGAAGGVARWRWRCSGAWAIDRGVDRPSAEADYLKSPGRRALVERERVVAAPASRCRKSGGPAWSTPRAATRSPTPAPDPLLRRVAACGLAQGGDFPTTVMPFILRGVTLYGINSVLVPNSERGKAWALMAQHLDARKLDAMAVDIGLSEAITHAPRLIDGQVRGRTVVDVRR